jgi:hypothetical protein
MSALYTDNDHENPVNEDGEYVVIVELEIDLEKVSFFLGQSTVK